MTLPKNPLLECLLFSLSSIYKLYEVERLEADPPSGISSANSTTDTADTYPLVCGDQMVYCNR